jgi:hypothetical protein
MNRFRNSMVVRVILGTIFILIAYSLWMALQKSW